VKGVKGTGAFTPIQAEPGQEIDADRPRRGKIGHVKRFRQWLFDILSVVSLVLCLVAAAFCVGLEHCLPTWLKPGSHGLIIPDSPSEFSIAFFEHGDVSVSIIKPSVGPLKCPVVHPAYAGNPISFRLKNVSPYYASLQSQEVAAEMKEDAWRRSFGSSTKWSMCGFALSRGPDFYYMVDFGVNSKSLYYSGNRFTVATPFAFWALLFLIPAVLWLRTAPRRFRQQSRSRQNLCIACGYDLRATPDRCPECGTIPPPKKQIASA
jgi:hypothetical protein